jgi:actin-related protein
MNCALRPKNPLLIAEVPDNPKANRERAIQILFETFRVSAMYLANQGALAVIKEQVCFVAADYEHEMATQCSSLVKSYELPDGRLITVGNERFRCPEALFQPSLLGIEAAGLHETLFSATMSSDVDVRAELCGSIVLAGGSSLFPGITERLRKEMSALLPASTKLKIVAPARRKYDVYLGGSIQASMSTFMHA